ncbi:MAG: hypothetical protein HY609_02375, partial [Deltaproteobacteria bacterium]|nr:hypothetical protein [Deltaproteobacteria bacterium]
MTTSLNIQATCEAIRTEKIDVDIGGEPAILLDSAAPYFIGNCREFLTNIAGAQEAQLEGREPSIWAPAAVHTAAAYLRRHKIPFRFAMSPSPFAFEIAALRSKTVQLGLGAYALFNEEELLKNLDHEMGHLRDDKLLGSFFPELDKIPSSKDAKKWSREKSIKICRAHITLFERRMSPGKERDEFRKLTKTIFGDFRSLSDNNLWVAEGVLAEALRAGEEVADPRWRRYLLGPRFMDFSLSPSLQRKFKGFEMVDAKGRRILDHRSMWVAFMKLAGIWEEFKKRGDVDPKLIQYFESDCAN